MTVTAAASGRFMLVRQQCILRDLLNRFGRGLRHRLRGAAQVSGPVRVQGIEHRVPLAPGAGSAAAVAAVRTAVPALEEDRPIGAEIETVAAIEVGICGLHRPDDLRIDAVNVIGNYDRKVLDFQRKRAQWKRRKAPAKYRGFQWNDARLLRANRVFLESLPEQIRLPLDDVEVLLVHGSPASINELLRD